MKQANVVRILGQHTQGRSSYDTCYIKRGEMGGKPITRLRIGHTLKENLGIHDGDRVRVGVMEDGRQVLIKDDSGPRLHTAGEQGLSLYCVFNLAMSPGADKVFATVEDGIIVFPANTMGER